MEFGSNCSTLQYSIETNCCNSFANPQNATSIICSFDVSSIINDVCSFSVKTVICDNIEGNLSEPISIMLKGLQCKEIYYNMHACYDVTHTIFACALYNNINIVPASPSVNVVPAYNYKEGNLTRITIIFNKVVSYMFV